MYQLKKKKKKWKEQDVDYICTIVRGILEADVSLDGYVYFEGENNMVNSSEVTLEFEFQFEHQNGKNRQFVSRVIA